MAKLKKKRTGKPPSKRRDTRCEVEEAWEMPKSVHKGWYTVTRYNNGCYEVFLHYCLIINDFV